MSPPQIGRPVSKRDDGCRLENFADTYEGVYDELFESGVVENKQ
jgi:hypothetical protein